MTPLVLLLLSSLVILGSQSKPFDRYQQSRELALLTQDNPGTSIELLRQIRRNIRRSQASLKLVISMERELQRVARHISDTFKEEPSSHLKRGSGSEWEESESIPFSAWAG